MRDANNQLTAWRLHSDYQQAGGRIQDEGVSWHEVQRSSPTVAVGLLQIQPKLHPCSMRNVP
eukprot:2491768-Pyramimonas_sp.AAC.1